MSAEHDKFWKLVDDIKTAMLTTRKDDTLPSRPMHAYCARGEGKIFFIIDMSSEKTHEIGEGDAVNLVFVDIAAQHYVSVTGTARVLRDPERQKAMWNPFAEAWLPQGPEAADVGLIEVTLDEAVYWDSPASKLVTLWKVAIANITQTPPSSDMGTVKF